MAANTDSMPQSTGHGYTLRGTVQQGAKRGRLLGFPTANIAVAPDAAAPPNGVYACWVRTGLDTGYGGVANIGVRPTFGEGALVCEVHIFDFDGDLYGKEIVVELVAFIRQEQAFASAQALQEQIQSDTTAAKALLKK